MPQSLPEWIHREVMKETRVLDWAAVSLQQPLVGEELLRKWISRGDHAQMEWIPAGLAARLNPLELLPNAKSILLFLWKYSQPLSIPTPDSNFQVAAYAQGEDYHHSASRWIQSVCEGLKDYAPSLQTRLFVDTLPIQERAWAAAAGLGWIGKNSLLLHPRHGSAFCIAGFLVDALVEKQGSVMVGKEFCGACTRCIDACPTKAIGLDKTVDSRRCISYLTIEKRGEFTPDESASVQGWMFGCDICQTVCPWNHKHLVQDITRVWPTERGAWDALLEPGNGLRKRLRGTPLDRTGRKGLLRNFLAQK